MERITAHYHEIALKGRNRGRFEHALRRNLARAVSDLAPTTVKSCVGRVMLETEADAAQVLERVRDVCGVAYAMRVESLPRDLEAVGLAVSTRVRERGEGTFRITTRRADKTYPLTSPEVDREVGTIVQRETGLPVRLKDPDTEAHLMLLPDRILFGLEKCPGVGGLPVGTGGRAVALMSGGFDSPVAAWRLIRRGCRIHFVHFHSHPLVDRTTQEKARDLVEALTRFQYDSGLSLVPLANIQTEVRLKAPDRMRVILYRRFMFRIAEAIAHKQGCDALVTGESLGQVASQTLENIRTIDAVAALPVLRPLVGCDKQEIIAEAERLGTYEISVQPDQDCCSLFVPAHPVTKATPARASDAEAELDIDALVKDAVDRTEVETFSWPKQ